MCQRTLTLLFLSATLVLTACGDAGDRDDFWETGRRAPPAWLEYQPSFVPVSLLRLVDAAGQPLAGVEVALYPLAPGSNTAERPPITATTLTDSSGELATPPLAAGAYWVQLTDENPSASALLIIAADNALAASPLALPVLRAKDEPLKPIGNDKLVAAVSGMVHDVHGPVAGAQVSISAGPFSNGAIATDLTGSDGAYSLILPAGGAVVPAMDDVTVRVVAAGYQELTESKLDISDGGSLAGLNLTLTAHATTGDAVYRESFDNRAEGAICGTWTGTLIYTSTAGNLWQEHHAGRALVNGAIDAGWVSLAPDDRSQGYLPDPITGAACWYGNAEAGNYLGTALTNGDGSFGGKPLGGGTSTEAHAAALVSPVIDLRGEVAPLALSFDTWWEIEAVNPNEDGFDLMQIEARVVGEEAWHTVARLNPMADPQTLTADLPYSNRGFNRAPAWLRQEPISLDAYAGRRLQLRFAFYTEDEFYNGFRGWLVDNVVIIRRTGSFPLWRESEGSSE